MISVTYIFETSDEGEEHVVCTTYVEQNQKNVTPEERTALDYFMSMVKTSCSYEKGMEIRERGDRND